MGKGLHMAASIPVGYLEQGPISFEGEELEGFAGEFRVAGCRAFNGGVKVVPAEKFNDASPDFLVYREAADGWEAIGTVHRNKRPGKDETLGFTLIAPGTPTVRLAGFRDGKRPSRDGGPMWRIVYFDESAGA